MTQSATSRRAVSPRICVSIRIKSRRSSRADFSSFSQSSASAALTRQLQQLVGIDGDFELQTDQAPPVSP